MFSSILLLAVVGAWFYYVAGKPVRPRPPDEQDLRIAKMKRDRLLRGERMWCGKKLAAYPIDELESSRCSVCNTPPPPRDW